MSERRSNHAGSAYWTDFRLIRESRKITLDEVHAVTRIPIGVLRDFESDGLRSHEQINNVYRKSLVTAYASVLGVDSDLARRTVTSSIDGAYDGSLARTYLSWSPASADDASDIDNASRGGSRRSRSASHRSLSALFEGRHQRIGSRVVGLVFLLLAVVAVVVLATGSP